MLLNVHSYYSLRYGTLSIEALIETLKAYGYDTAVMTDINNSSAILDFIKVCREKLFHGLAGIEFRNGDELLYIGIAKNEQGFQELNEFLTEANLNKKQLPSRPPEFNAVFIVYPFESIAPRDLRANEYIGIKPRQLTKITFHSAAERSRYVVWHPVTFKDKTAYRLHCQLRAIDNNLLLSQLTASQIAGVDEMLIPRQQLLAVYANAPEIIANTEKLFSECRFDFDFTTVKNKQTFTGHRYDDKLLLEKLAMEGMRYRYGKGNSEALRRVKLELDIIDKLGFSSYFLITWDIVRYAMSRGFYHVGRGSGANSVVAYCLKITDVCPIELDLYFERFLNPKRKSPPDFDIDFGWNERNDVYDYIFKRYGHKHTALMGAMSTFRDRSIIRELGKVYGLPKGDIDRIIRESDAVLNKHEITDLILSVYSQVEDFPNLRTIHASGVLISELPITSYTALDLPPKGFQTAQIDMYTAEDIGFEKFDILSQRGIANIKETAEIVKQNRGIKLDVHEVANFKADPLIRDQLKSADTIGCFYIESPAMRGLLTKLRCGDYLTLVAASSIIRPGVAKSGMMKQYIERFHHPEKTVYLHPVMEEQLKETRGVMVYQEDVLKIGHHFGGLDLADADVLRRLMSGKNRGKHHLIKIQDKFFNNCMQKGYDPVITKEVWRQIESFAGYSFSKAHSASFAVESYQSLFLKTYYPQEFYVAVINNFGGFYPTWVYIHAARKSGATIHLPCVNKSQFTTRITGSDVYLGFQHIQNLESQFAHGIVEEREQHGDYTDLENLIVRNALSLEQAIILIRISACRFTGKNKKALLWECHALLSKKGKHESGITLFNHAPKKFTMPEFETTLLEDLYDEIELMRFTVSAPFFQLLQTEFRGDVMAKELMNYVGKVVRMVGEYVCCKTLITVKYEPMAFGTFIDASGDFFDTTNFSRVLKVYPFKGGGVYLIMGKVVEEFGFPSIEVQKMAKLSNRGDPRII